MSLPAINALRFDVPSYLEWEDKQTEKHEYRDGVVVTRAECSDAHVTIMGNVAMALRQHLRGGPCTAWGYSCRSRPCTRKCGWRTRARIPESCIKKAGVKPAERQGIHRPCWGSGFLGQIRPLRRWDKRNQLLKQ